MLKLGATNTVSSLYSCDDLLYSINLEVFFLWSRHEDKQYMKNNH